MTTHKMTFFASLLSFAILQSCASKEGNESADTGAGADTDTDTDTDVDCSEEEVSCIDDYEKIACGEVTGDKNASVAGQLIHEDGTPYADAIVQLCAEVCLVETSDANGNFAFSGIEGGCYAIDAHHQEDHTTKILTFIEIETGENRTLSEPMKLYAFDDDLTIDCEPDLALGNLTISANAANDNSYKPPFGHGDETNVEYVQVDPADSGLPLDLINGEVVGMWYFGPWSTEMESGWAITATDLPGVSEGDTVQLITGDYFGMSWNIGGTATASADGSVAFSKDDCGGMHFLSTLLLVKQ